MARKFPLALQIADAANGDTPLHTLSRGVAAAAVPPLQVLECFVELYPAALAAKNKAGETPLHLLLLPSGGQMHSPLLQQKQQQQGKQQQQHKLPGQMLIRLVDKYPRALEVSNARNSTPLHLLCSSSNSSGELSYVAFQYMVQKFPNALGMIDDTKDTPLLLLCKQRKAAPIQAIWLAMERYPEAIEIADGCNNTPLHILCQDGDGLARLQTLQYMTELSSSSNSGMTPPGRLVPLGERVNDAGETPLLILCKNRQAPIHKIMFMIQQYPKALEIPDVDNKKPSDYVYLPPDVAATSSSSSNPTLGETPPTFAPHHDQH